MKKDYVGNHKVSSITEKITSVKVELDDFVKIVTDSGAGFTISPQNTKVVPKVGDTITFYTIWVTRVVGIELNGELLYWLPDNEVFSWR